MDRDPLLAGAADLGAHRPEQARQVDDLGLPRWVAHDRATLGEDGVDNAANYVMSLSGREVDTAKAAEGKTYCYDFHATVLHLLGIDHERLTYRYAGRDFRLTDVHGNVLHDVLA